MSIIKSLIIPPLAIYSLVVVANSFAELAISCVDITEWSNTGRLLYFTFSLIGCVVSLACSHGSGGDDK